jgi:hypothetical protein
MNALTIQTAPPVFTFLLRVKAGGEIMSLVRKNRSILGTIISIIVKRKRIPVRR